MPLGLQTTGNSTRQARMSVLPTSTILPTAKLAHDTLDVQVQASTLSVQVICGICGSPHGSRGRVPPRPPRVKIKKLKSGDLSM